MKRTLLSTVLALAVLTAIPAQAQEIELPEFTMEERWERMAFLLVGWEVAIISMGEQHGMTPEEVGHWVGKYFSQGWLGGREAVQLLTAMNRNHMAFPGATSEVVSSTPTSLVARFNRPGDSQMGAGGVTMGVSTEDLNTMLVALNQTIADWNGVALEVETDGDHDVLTMETLYGPIQASNDLRWNRGNYLSWLTWLQLMGMKLESGMTAREVGEADAALYASTWSARTPWQLFRGMHWNAMTDPNYSCEVVSAGPDEVRARCPIQYEAVVTNAGVQFNVTPEAVTEANQAFAEGVAEYLGMRWVETVEDGVRVITVTRR
ncbi:MAG: hypothetical protein HKO65_01850 [Gemmatimonadetes bacterium]|nr:hypothetical protein [Gemmatimonadota bacterium]NNM03819.1 hypothetical protein [Gemmatimonadota bacterium]